MRWLPDQWGVADDKWGGDEAMTVAVAITRPTCGLPP